MGRMATSSVSKPMGARPAGGNGRYYAAAPCSSIESRRNGGRRREPSVPTANVGWKTAQVKLRWGNIVGAGAAEPAASRFPLRLGSSRSSARGRRRSHRAPTCRSGRADPCTGLRSRLTLARCIALSQNSRWFCSAWPAAATRFCSGSTGNAFGDDVLGCAGTRLRQAFEIRRQHQRLPLRHLVSRFDVCDFAPTPR